MFRLLILSAVSFSLTAAFACDDAGSKCATVYKGERCGYHRFSIADKESVIDLGEVDMDNSINSVVVTRGCMLMMWKKDHLQGDYRIFVGNAASEQYYQVDPGFAAEASSARCSCNIQSTLTNCFNQ